MVHNIAGHVFVFPIGLDIPVRRFFLGDWSVEARRPTGPYVLNEEASSRLDTQGML
jgi:hypothetical protein